MINKSFSDAFETLNKEGVTGIYYLPAKGLIGEDGEATVDGVHLTDLGFYRMAQSIIKKLKTIL